MKNESSKVNGKKVFERRGKIFAYCMVSVAVVHFLIFFIYLNFEQFRLAFTYELLDGSEKFAGWDNFTKIFTDFLLPNSIMLYSLVNTMQYWLMGVVKLVITVIVSYFLWKKVAGFKLFTILFFIPSIIPSVLYITMFKNMISSVGPLAIILKDLFNYELPPLLAQPETATNTIVFFSLWAGYGVNMLLYLGALGRIPDSVIDAGKIDGCGWVRELWSIVLPLIWETLSVMLILNVSTLFTATGPILLFTNGVEYNHTYTLSFWIYMKVDAGELHYPSAVGLFYTVVAIPLVILSRWITNKLNKEVTY